MSRLLNIRVQTALVVLLFLGSLAVLLYNTLNTLALPQRELDARNHLRAASEELARQAAPLTDALRGKPGAKRDDMDTKLRGIANRVLESYPAVEGGFYIARDKSFSGYAYPATVHAIDSQPRNEPPPLEAPIIRQQTEQSLNSGGILLRTEDVGRRSGGHVPHHLAH